ncbi:MAG: hypothetical protein HN336_01980 [Lentimicrobiaceae bacterium]|jgi:hypothetical protein|nr:hypothetical protein [Lentimicrobiaceae bacterium]MBT3454546.1 hypothetical protein [Lentimicrobiaceae bacterium]MBT3818140.1 hypothetical protein [Lentimicrobiaceae bacterium]MBT4061441.1 hypothetical protein [Lentimicrobiaceae bacterium]MBT4191181.1 hypothetical protein [Lentimicrobiaceae bacterium]
MKISKKEMRLMVEILYSILFAIIYIPLIYKNRIALLNDPSDFTGLIIEIIVASIIYYTVSYIIIESICRKNIINDERDSLIKLKVYKWGYIIFEVFLIGLISFTIWANKKPAFSIGIEDLIFYILVSVVMITFIKSSIQLFLYRTS